jgi:hypothetical protein
VNATTFAEDLAFLRGHTDIIVLGETEAGARVVLAPAWQGRVVTSTADLDGRPGFGWINRSLIRSGTVMPHINPFGGEDRFWLGPEGGQFSVYFAKGAPFTRDHWYVPAAFDTQPFETVEQSPNHAVFRAAFTLTNYVGTRFEVGVRREIRLLGGETVLRTLGVSISQDVAVVAFESINTLINTGRGAWCKETGLLSIWIAGMFPSSPSATIVVPIRIGSESAFGNKVTADYFGVVPSERLRTTQDSILFRGDGKFRSKIGISQKRSLGMLGSYDAGSRSLTIVQFTEANVEADYVNSLWALQDDPYRGDVINCYNDGPPAPGVQQLGAFYELESSSRAAALLPEQSIDHFHRTIHLTGPQVELDSVARAVLGVALATLTRNIAETRE